MRRKKMGVWIGERKEIRNDMQETPCLMLKRKETASNLRYVVFLFFGFFFCVSSDSFQLLSSRFEQKERVREWEEGKGKG